MDTKCTAKRIVRHSLAAAHHKTLSQH